jgi:regulator of sigma E protease
MMSTTIAVFIFVISALVFIHELGHYLVARWYGVRVITFSIGFGPKLLRVTRHGTEYCLSAIPLGGYVRMATGQPATARHDEFYGKTKWQRVLILAAGPAMNFAFAAAALTALVMHGIDLQGPAGTPDLLQAVRVGVLATIAIGADMFGNLAGLFSGAVSPQQFAGPVGLAQIVGASFRTGWTDLAALISLISVNLGLMNLLPLPGLDGGQIALIALEGARGRDFTIAVRRRILKVGFAVLLGVTAASVYNDLNRLAGAPTPDRPAAAAQRPSPSAVPASSR